MAEAFFKTGRGFSINGDVEIIRGGGAPSGGDSDVVGVGSLYLDTTNGQLYKKHTAGTGSNKWVLMVDQDALDAVVGGISWREPALVRDNTVYADIAAVETAANVADTIDGITINSGDRVLLTNLTSGNENVYLVSGTSGNWTFTEETGNPATDGDSVYVQEGTDSDNVYTFNGTSWVLTSSSDTSGELGYIRDFIGKGSAGNEGTSYTSTFNITNGTSLEAALGAVDAAIGDRAYSSTNVVTASSDLATAIEAIDTAIGVYTNYSSNVFVTDSDTLAVAIGKLDAGIDNRISAQVQNGISGTATADEVLVDSYSAVKWVVTIRDASTPGNVEAFEVLALHNGTASADASSTDWTSYGHLKVGSGVSGVDWDIDLNGTGVSQTIRLRVTTGVSANVKITRIPVAA